MPPHLIWNGSATGAEGSRNGSISVDRICQTDVEQ